MMRREEEPPMRRLIAAALLLLLGLALTPARTSEAAETFGIEPDRKLAKALEKAADACFQCGDEAKGLGLYSYTRSFFNHALQYDPDHRGTRRVMGYKKKRGTWVLEEDLVPKGDEIVEAKRPELEAKLAERTSGHRKKPAEDLWEFVADHKLERPQRMLALYHVLRLCPEYREAQQAMRVKPGSRGLVHALDDEAETMRVKWIDGGADGAAIEEETAYEKAGFKMENWRGEWIVVHALIGDKSAEWARTLTKYAGAAHTRSREILGLEQLPAPADDATRFHYTVFSERDAYSKFIEACSNIKNDVTRRESARSGFGARVYGPEGAAFQQPNVENDHFVRDAIAHDLGTRLIGYHTSWSGYWLARGVGYLNSSEMNGSIEQRFWVPKSTAVIESGGREALPGLGFCAANWRLTVAMDVAAGKAMSPAQLAAVRIADYDERHMAYAFCFAEFLSKQHTERLGKFLVSARAERVRRAADKKSDEDAQESVKRLLASLEMDEEQFKQAFATWVAESFVRLPDQE
jgi:hypothetical protein